MTHAHSVVKNSARINNYKMMSLRDVCLITLRDSGIPYQVADRLTEGRRFDQSAQVFRLVVQEMWSAFKQEVARGELSYTNDGMEDLLLQIRQMIRTRYRTNSRTTFEATPEFPEATGYEVPANRRVSSTSCDTFGYVNTK